MTGTANGTAYKTRIVVRKPADNSRFSGIVLAESMHPSGNAWMFHFTHTYTMTSGHIGVEIVTSDPAQFVEFNGARYSDMRVQPGQANEIIAQVGALLRSTQTGNPLNGLRMRKMLLAGTSASAGVLINYLPAHMAYRLSDMKPIYDGFLPTSNGTNIRQIDVPMIQVPTTTEASRGNVPVASGRRQARRSVPRLRVSRHAAPRHARCRSVSPEPVQEPDHAVADEHLYVGRPSSSGRMDRQGDRATAGRSHPGRSEHEQRWFADCARRARQSEGRHQKPLRRRAGREIRLPERRRGAADAEHGALGVAANRGRHRRPVSSDGISDRDDCAGAEEAVRQQGRVRCEGARAR